MLHGPFRVLHLLCSAPNEVECNLVKLKQGGPFTDQQSMTTFVTRQSNFDDKQHVEQTVALITKRIAQEMLQIISGPSEYCIFCKI